MKKQMFKVVITAGMDYTDNLKNALEEEDVEVITVPKDAEAVLTALKTGVNAAVLEFSMKGMDASAVISRAKQTISPLPKIVVASADDSEATEALVIKSGAALYSIKPFDCVMLGSTIIKMLGNISPFIQKDGKQVGMEQIITDVMHQIGVPAHIKGYHYLRTSIHLCINDGAMISAVTKLLYPTVANQYKTTASRVERAIRHAIEVAWDRGDVDTLNSYFGYTIHNGRGKPTNSEFIAMISDKLKLKHQRFREG
ncbi:MAG: sporulation transcription factor Spo0A [Oscillospiraceae bacterium]|nr:sporulation transcription factor Spo0A [Oscillospiraceae bacterium]